MDTFRGPMLDADYFNDILPGQIQKHGSSATPEVRLHDGRSFNARSIHTVKPGYVVLEVYPPAGTPIKLKDRAQTAVESGQTIFNSDLVALPYEGIQQVLTTTSTPSEAERIGFRGR